jgi:CheY-like chemotaxis protein
MSAKSTATSSGGPSKRIYLVGGGLDKWFLVAGSMQQAGFDLRPTSAEANLEAIARLAAGEGAVVLLDVAADPEQGLARVRVLRAAARDLAVVVAAESFSLDQAQRLRAAGVHCLLLHPLDAQRVRAALEAVLVAVAEHRAAPAGGRAKRVLVVDDDKDFRTSVTALLESRGYTVSCAATGQDGLKLAIAERPDLIILDVMMENTWAGYEVNQTIKFQSGYESLRQTPILMVSSIPQAPQDRFASSAEVTGLCPDSYLTKPIDIPEFLERVRRLLDEGVAAAPPSEPGGTARS